MRVLFFLFLTNISPPLHPSSLHKLSRSSSSSSSGAGRRLLQDFATLFFIFTSFSLVSGYALSDLLDFVVRCEFNKCSLRVRLVLINYD
jgi:hypothetical protein